jgi:hypothetical protein
MLVDVNCKSVVSIDIESGEAFKLLVKTLYMDFILDDSREYYTRKGRFEELSVFTIVDGHDELYDDRGELYKALMNVAKCIFPNI